MSATAEPGGLTGAARSLRRWWTCAARRIGDVQARILLSAFYFLILGPFALLVLGNGVVEQRAP